MPAIPAIIMAGATIGSGVAAAKMSSNASKNASDISTAAANHAADLSYRGNTDALDFQKAEADRQAARDEVTQHANYDMWAARERRVGSIGQMVGLGPREIPGYVPINPSTAGAAGASGASSAAPGAPGQGDAAAFIANYQKTHSPTEGPSGIMNAMKAAGYNVAPYMYGQTPSGNEISLNGGKYKVISGENGPNPSWYQAGMNDGAPMQAPSAARTNSVASYLTAPPARRVAPPIAPALAMPSPYHVGSVGSYL